MFYISGIAENINATVRLFADDAIAYLAIATDRDAQTLQDDLTKLGVWEQRWHMEFHPEKCHVPTISRKRNLVHHEYVLHGHKLQHVDSVKYLGITLTSDFSWNKHIDNTVNKANGSLSFLRTEFTDKFCKTENDCIYIHFTTYLGICPVSLESIYQVQ